MLKGVELNIQRKNYGNNSRCLPVRDSQIKIGKSDWNYISYDEFFNVDGVSVNPKYWCGLLSP